MKKPIFKAGDKVYCPTLGGEVFAVENAHPDPNNIDEYILTIGKNSLFNKHGQMFADKLPKLFHTTQSNQKALETLYGCYFEEAPTNYAIIKQLLSKQKYVACYVSDDFESPYDPDNLDEFESIDIINGISHDDDSYPFVGLSHNWRYAVPFDIKTGEVIECVENA